MQKENRRLREMLNRAYIYLGEHNNIIPPEIKSFRKEIKQVLESPPLIEEIKNLPPQNDNIGVGYSTVNEVRRYEKPHKIHNSYCECGSNKYHTIKPGLGKVVKQCMKCMKEVK